MKAGISRTNERGPGSPGSRNGEEGMKGLLSRNGLGGTYWRGDEQLALKCRPPGISLSISLLQYPLIPRVERNLEKQSYRRKTS